MGRMGLDPLDRFLVYVEIDLDGCWLWRGFKTPNGYGSFKHDGKPIGAHQWAWENLVGPVTHLVNVRRGHEARRSEVLTFGTV